MLDFEGVERAEDEYPPPWSDARELNLNHAIATFKRYKKVDVARVGFVTHDEITWLGASPHGLIGNDACLYVRHRKTLKTLAEGRDKISKVEVAKFNTILFVTGRSRMIVADYWSGGDRVPDRMYINAVTHDYTTFSEVVLSRLTVLWRDVSARIVDRRRPLI